MFSTLKHLILASSSPRRQQFLKNLGIEFTVITADIDETPSTNERPHNFALRMANDKAMKVALENRSSWVIGADTIVTLQDGTILGKPSNKTEALIMLNSLNNKTHRVMTGLCLCCLDQDISTTLVETTEVTFANISEDVLKAYIKTQEPFDKAGGYGIQGLGSFLVKTINGSCSNVIGLPISQLTGKLLEHKIIAPAEPTENVKNLTTSTHDDT